MDLFKPVVPDVALHQNFVRTLDPTSQPVREVLNQWADGFVDRDGKFVREFQTTYNSSFWELYLFAVLKERGLEVDFSVDAPDFVCAHHPIAIEGAIASHAQDDVPEWQKTFEGVVHDDVGGAYIRSIVRLSNAFHAKSNAFTSRYSGLPHMAGRSYIIAIANIGTQDFNMLGDVAMQRLLYDVWEERQVYKPNGAPIAVGLFRSEAFAHVSAVMYSSVATFGKARALSDDQNPFVFHAIRIKDNFTPIRVVASKSDYRESLTDGLRIFTNPFATIPFDLGLFDDPGIRTFLADENGNFLVSCHPEGDLCMRMVQQLVQKD